MHSTSPRCERPGGKSDYAEYISTEFTTIFFQIHYNIAMPTREQLLAPLLKINTLIDSHRPLSGVLNECVTIIQQLLLSDVCSIYLLDPTKDRLVLEATHGLAPDSIGKASLPLGKGLVGKSFAQLAPVSSSDVFHDADFAYLPETEEDRYHSLLAVPILYQNRPLGVLTIQHADHRDYASYEIQFLQLIATQLGPLINRARFQSELDKTFHPTDTPAFLLHNELIKGKAASPGIAWGKVLISKTPGLDSRFHLQLPDSPAEQVALFQNAVKAFIADINVMRSRAATQLSATELAIFDAYDLLLAKDNFQDQVIERILSGKPLPQAVKEVIDGIAEPLLESEDLYLRERAFDIEDLGTQLLSRLVEQTTSDSGAQRPSSPHILVCQRLPIFDLINLCTPDIKGIVCEEGGTTGHAAMLAQSLGIPAVMGFKGLMRKLTDNDTILIDGASGILFINPDEPTLKLFREKAKSIASGLLQSAGRPVLEKIASPYPIEIAANVGSLAQMKLIKATGADAVGLYRTEFPFLIRRSVPSEDEQFAIYRQVLEEAANMEVTFRILDIGGDKPLSSLMPHPEENPALGWRAMRLALARPEIFELQLRALLRASPFGNMRLLFPMVSSLEEITLIKDHVANVHQELRNRGQAFVENIPLGIMIEVPAAVALAEELIEEVDFFSVGTNDLIQYTLAVDRNNPEVSEFYDPFHPAIARAIMHVADVAHRAGKKVSVCGEMAADTVFLPFFLANRIDTLSVNPTYIPILKRYLLSHRFTDLDRTLLLKPKNSSEFKQLLQKMAS